MNKVITVNVFQGITVDLVCPLYTPMQSLDYDTKAEVLFASVEYITNRISFYFIV